MPIRFLAMTGVVAAAAVLGRLQLSAFWRQLFAFLPKPGEQQPALRRSPSTGRTPSHSWSVFGCLIFSTGRVG